MTETSNFPVKSLLIAQGYFSMDFLGPQVFFFFFCSRSYYKVSINRIQISVVLGASYLVAFGNGEATILIAHVSVLVANERNDTQIHGESLG